MALALISLSVVGINNRTVIRILTIIAFFQSLFWIIVTPGPRVLPWDFAAQNNVALYIVQNGYVPKPLGEIYRPGYVSYPSPFILWAILSEITSIPTNLLMISPILTCSMYIVFLWIVLDILSMIRIEFRPMVIALLGSVFIVNFKLTEIFIYQNYGRTLLLFTLYLIFKNLLSNNSKLRPLAIITIINITFSHSESSIALLIALLGLTIKLFERLERRINVAAIPIITFISFALHHLYEVTYFSTVLVDMLKKTLESIIKESGEILTIGLAKYTPYDYTMLELLLYATSLFLLSLSALSSFIIGVAIYLKHRKITFYLGPLTFIGASFVLLFWFSPYKSDISLKFIPALSIITTLSLLELSRKGYLGAHPKKYFKPLRYFLVLCALMIVLGFAIRSNASIFSTLYQPYHGFMLLLDLSGLTELMSSAGSYNLVLIDSPSLPYYFIKDYIGPRLAISYSIVVAEAEEAYYKHRLINALPAPRFVQGMPTLSDDVPQGRDLIIGETNVISGLKYASIIFNTDSIGMGMCSICTVS